MSPQHVELPLGGACPGVSGFGASPAPPARPSERDLSTASTPPTKQRRWIWRVTIWDMFCSHLVQSLTRQRRNERTQKRWAEHSKPPSKLEVQNFSGLRSPLQACDLACEDEHMLKCLCSMSGGSDDAGQVRPQQFLDSRAESARRLTTRGAAGRHPKIASCWDIFGCWSSHRICISIALNRTQLLFNH